jgi:hypothetical protein
VRGAPLGFLLLGRGATLRFDRAADFVEAHEGKRVPIEVLEPGESAAPRESVRSGCRGHRRRVCCVARPIVDKAPETWCGAEANAPAPPLGVGRGQILGDEGDVCGTADEPRLGRAGSGLDEREYCRPVRGSHRQQALAGPDASVEGDVKSEGVHVKLETSRLVLDVDVHRVDTKVGIRHRQCHSCSNRPLVLYGLDPTAGFWTSGLSAPRG